ncbi:spore germination protein GerPC [Radiobacillus sp. PE A8.2]|uniref:spore germination protein GerPC n=1 Tax=Radiobacillus sp. PE A8.2 TaxID=3380349 RepID=UPI0038911121
MSYSNDWYAYIANLQNYIKQMDTKIQQLEQRITLLETNAANKKHTNIEKLEYHFDQLKIERLDGTLHIGLTPEDLEKVDSMAINQVPQNNKPEPIQQPLEQQLVSQLDTYVTEQGSPYVEQLAYEYGYPMNDSYRNLIINDVRKQLPSRISHYTNEGKQNHRFQDDHQLSNYVIEKVQKEISHSLRQFFQNDVNKGDS